MNALGERIRALRKEKKLTLADVAGDKLTKGMLSLIENGKAQPSIESLHHIASQLQVDPSVLIGSQNIDNLRNLLNKVEELWEKRSDIKNVKMVQQLISPLIQQLPDTYEGARLLDLYGRSFYFTDHTADGLYLNKAKSMYDKMNSHNELVKIYIFLALVQFEKNNYETTLQIILDVKKEAKKSNWQLHTITGFELNYYETMLYYAVGKYEVASKKLKEALDLTRETGIFYLNSELYKLACIEALMSGNDDNRIYYLNKMRQYAEFAEDEVSFDFIKFLNIHYLSTYTHEYEKALLLLEESFFSSQQEGLEQGLFDNFIRLEKGVILYGLKRYSESLAELSQFSVPSYLHHPLDLALFYRVYTYRALCYVELGDLQKAKEEISIGVDYMESLPPTPYKTFMLEVYERITNEKLK